MNYQWLDQQQQPQQLTFSLDKQAINASQQSQTEYKPQVVQRYIYVELMKQAQQINPKEARIKIVQRGDRLEFKITSRSAQMRQKWLETMTETQGTAFQQYLSDNHYIEFTDHMGQTGILPDHLRYIEENKAQVLVVAQALYSQLEKGSNTKEFINHLLSWVQSIPYDRLEGRIDNNGAGFFSPLKVLVNNRGDCDSKAVLTAAVIRSLLPNLGMAIVYLPNHALLAVDLGKRTDGRDIEILGNAHVLIEPTGPALLSIGDVSDETARQIAIGNYMSVVIP
ncbi:hypothetical protein GCM10009114_09190 [Aliiglaciecola litoralis]|uniref:Transglutaminase-like domain-containing protein n=2 Tax=Aliiglaciecola litoralis TaxID=582857 RepID=A0ABN1LE36_9ALTE